MPSEIDQDKQIVPETSLQKTKLKCTRAFENWCVKGVLICIRKLEGDSVWKWKGGDMRTFQQFISEVKTPSLANDLRTSLDCCQWNISLLTHRWWPPMANLCGLHKTSWVGKKTKWRERHLHGPEIGSLLNCPDHNPDIGTGNFLTAFTWHS